MKNRIFISSLMLCLACFAGSALADDAPQSAVELADQAPILDTPDSSETPSALELAETPIVEAACWSQFCANTGTRYGYGGNCTLAQDDLDQVLVAESYLVCPGVVIGVDTTYGTCSGGGTQGECKFSGSADITCKICPGQSCNGPGGA